MMMAVAITCFGLQVFAQYHPVKHHEVTGDEIAVNKAGSYGKQGTTYVLTNDITSEKSTIFLGNDVTLDLNGYAITYADGNYNHIENSGFEEGLKGWNISKAPGAKVVNTADVHVFLGKKLMSLKAGDEIVSPYVYLPVPNRSYFAMCGVTGHYWHDMQKYPQDEMMVSVYVEDEKGHEVRCMNKYGDGERLGCPAENKRPRLGGGFVYAHLHGLPAGKYRVRVKAVNDCLVDEIDIRPAMDVGVSIIDKTVPLASYDHVIMESRPPTIPSFYDYTADMKTGKPLKSLPRATGSGTITIKNGVIENGVEGIQSWGIQSSANEVKVILDNVDFKTSGISCAAADVPYAGISDCRFDVNMPFLIQRHVGLCSVIIRGDNPTEIRNSAFYGGEGCLSVKGKYSLVHDNLFVNAQTVTNHYSIMGTGDSSKIYHNIFEPRQGSGIYVSRYTEVADNIFRIETSPPTCEYGREEYSTAAIRLGDYDALPGSPRASIGSRIHGNKIYITARNYPEPKSFIPMSWGIFYSARGGENDVYDNEFFINKVEPNSKVKAAALYICGGLKYFGGEFYNNRITTNVPAAWIATIYGGAAHSDLHDNTIIPFGYATDHTFTIGSEGCEECVSEDVEFRSNEVKGGTFVIEATNQANTYKVYWSLVLKVTDKLGHPLQNEEVKIADRNGLKVFEAKTDAKGQIRTELPEYAADGQQKTFSSPYLVTTGGKDKEISLDSNTSATIIVE